MHTNTRVHPCSVPKERSRCIRTGLLGLSALFIASAVTAAPPLPGAVYTTDQNGTQVNGNIYAAKTDVYINGGPPASAPCTAAGLPDGDYYFQVTDPSGQVLLSSDAIGERKVKVTGGVIAAYLGTTHGTGTGKCSGVNVQLSPYNDTPNAGGEYKAWMTPVADYSPGSGKHGFRPNKSKTDNFKVKPTQPLRVVCLQDLSLCNDPGICGAQEGVQFNYANPAVTGGTAPYTFTFNPPPGSTFGLGFNLVIVTVTDANGQIGTSHCAITVLDCEAPEITCPDNIELVGCQTAGTIDVGQATATDNCADPVTVTGVRSDGKALNDTYPIGVTTITWTADDGNGNAASCDQTVAILPKGNQGTDPGECFATLNPGVPQIMDNCPGATVVGVRDDGAALNDPYPVGLTIITWTVTDAAGNSVSCKQKVQVSDKEAPKITCPEDIVVNNDLGECFATVDPGEPTVSDNCPGVTFKGTRSDGKELTDPYPVGMTTITWVATDAWCNESLCEQKITVKDNEKPKINCPANITANNDEGECFALVDPGTPNVSDNCPGVTFKGVRDDGKALTDPYPVGTTTITWTATDAAGNQASCDQTITVEDAEKPKITCPDSIVANNDQGECFATVDPGTATATDNCDGVTVKGVRDDGKALNDPYPVGTTTITWTATDAAGNTASCDQTITVKDNEKPVITCPDNIAANNDQGECFATVDPGTATATDNCDGVTVKGVRDDGKALNEPYPVGTTTITWTATDAAGNTASCDQTITVKDNEKPVITCPDNIAANNDQGECFATVDPGTATATDNCDGVTVKGVRDDGKALNDPYPVGTTTITWTATDAAGNTASCDQTITVKDNEKPVITCPDNIAANNDQGECFATVDPGTATATDNCDGVTVKGVRDDGKALNEPYPVGTTTITWTATDAAGNTASCDQTVTVKDNEKPSIECPTDITVANDEGECFATVDPGSPTVGDNCLGVTFKGVRSDGLALTDPYPVGTTTITWTATDAAGNTAQCIQKVTVKDTEPPKIICPADID